MKVEVRLAVQRFEDKDGIIVGKRIKKKKRCCNKRRNMKRSAAVPEVPLALQGLFLACRDVFKGVGTVPSPSDVHKLCHILDGMMPEDVGLSRDLQFFSPITEVKGTPRVTYTNIYKCEKFSLCIFFLPSTAMIPLHNHPGMTVFSKLLLGTMHIKAYDLVDTSISNDSLPPSELKLARLTADRVFAAPCNTSVLYPTSGGNIHAVTAITPCAFLDVIGPPYSKEDGRDCTYYRDIPYSALSNGGRKMCEEENECCYGWLEEIEMPKELEMDGIEYLGPQVNENFSQYQQS